jgi:hypothetical protein
MSIRVATYFPFNVTCYLNGHSFVAQDLTRAGVGFHKADNAFVGVTDVNALRAAANRLSATILERRCGYWVHRLVPVFSPAERAAGLTGRHGVATNYASAFVIRNSAMHRTICWTMTSATNAPEGPVPR